MIFKLFGRKEQKRNDDGEDCYLKTYFIPIKIKMKFSRTWNNGESIELIELSW